MGRNPLNQMSAWLRPLLALALLMQPLGGPAWAGRCSGEVARFLEQWRVLHPEEAASVVRSAETAEERLRRFYQGTEPGPSYSGNEGTVHTSPLVPDRTIKVWAPNRQELFNDAVDFLVAARRETSQIPAIADKFRVVQVFERGPGWISREFATESRTLAEAMRTDQTAVSAFQELRRTALAMAARTRSPVLRRLASMLGTNPVSLNLHWDALTRQIVMIDGF